MFDIWGHAITENLKHLWWLSTKEYQKKHKEKHLYYWGPKPLSGNFLEIACLAGVNAEKLRYIDRVLLFKSIIIPDISFDSSAGKASKEYLDTIDLIISNIKPYFRKGVEKLFLSERESSRLWGMKNIEKVARSAGYKVNYPAEHPLREQISVFRSASCVLSFESSIGHNTVFCHPKIKLTMLRKESYTNKYQPIINKLRDFDVNTVDTSLSILNDKRFPYGGLFFVYANDAVCQAISSTIHSIGNGSGNQSMPITQQYANLFPYNTFKHYIGYNLWGNEEDLSHKLNVSDSQAKCISREITKYRNWQLNRISKMFRFIPLPHDIKENHH